MEDNWVFEHEVRFGGAEGVFLGLGPTGVLISREMRLECGPLDGRVKAWFDFDLEAVRTELRDLLARSDLTGRVRISGAEHGEFSSIADLDHGLGVISNTVASGFARADGGGTLTLTTDQSCLRQALSERDQVPGYAFWFGLQAAATSDQERRNEGGPALSWSLLGCRARRSVGASLRRLLRRTRHSWLETMRVGRTNDRVTRADRVTDDRASRSMRVTRARLATLAKRSASRRDVYGRFQTRSRLHAYSLRCR